MFRKRSLLIASKHKKERVIAPIFQKSLGVKPVVAKKFDTDALGTFTGETERKDHPLITIRNKCLQAMQLYNCDLGIASEGSFGSHPFLFTLNADEELLLFIDRKNGLEIMVRELSTDTNFDGQEIQTEEQLVRFAKRAKFPSHALITRKSKHESSDITKGIKDWELLMGSFSQLKDKHGAAYVETDMRAMHNPTRMKVIEKAAHKLLEKIKTCCPLCNTPGFGIAEERPGLPCECCHSPTRSVLSYLYKCQKCSFIQEEMFPRQKTYESAMYCDWCNP